MTEVDTFIHPTAQVSEGAVIGHGCYIGPYCVIGDHVTLGCGNYLHSHVVIDGNTTVGQNNRFYPFSTYGLPPQDLKYRGEDSFLIIGDDNTFRENVSVNSGTSANEGKTIIGNGCHLLLASHIGHDCFLGDHIIISGGALIAGHVRIDDRAVISGGALVVQKLRVGAGAFISAGSKVSRHVPPYIMVSGFETNFRGLNLVWLRRQKVNRRTIKDLGAITQGLFNRKDENLGKALACLEKRYPHPVQEVSDFFKFINEVGTSKLPLSTTKKGHDEEG